MVRYAQKGGDEIVPTLFRLIAMPELNGWKSTAITALSFCISGFAGLLAAIAMSWVSDTGETVRADHDRVVVHELMLSDVRDDIGEIKSTQKQILMKLNNLDKQLP